LRISRILYMMIIHLGSMLPLTSSGYPGRGGHTSKCPHFTLLQMGFTSSISHLMDWCAFTAPFHLYNVFTRCSLLSVALSIALPLLGVTQHPCPAESGLSSSRIRDATIYSTQAHLKDTIFM